MEIGCINILMNPDLKDIIKIERTSGFAEERSQEIGSNIKEENPFRVAYSITSRKLDEIEALIFRKFDDYRKNKRKNTFKISIDKAIEIVEKVALQIASRNCKSSA